MYNIKMVFEMKQIMRLSILAVCALMLVCCNKTKEHPLDIVGEWKLENINGVPASSLATDGTGGLDIYVSFASDKTFETFQRLHDGTSYYRYSGTYAIAGHNIVSGRYADGNSWGAEYSVSLEDGFLVMTGEGDECVYISTSIPEDVRSSSLDVKSSFDTSVPAPFL